MKVSRNCFIQVWYVIDLALYFLSTEQVIFTSLSDGEGDLSERGGGSLLTGRVGDEPGGVVENPPKSVM